MRKNQPAVTPDQLVDKVRPFLGKSLKQVSDLTGVPFCGHSKAKGAMGHFIEDVVGLPRGNDRLDYDWGDLKSLTFHNNGRLGACVIGSLNSLAHEMIDEDVSFDDFVLGKKIAQTVFVTICTNRKGGGPACEGWEKFTLKTVSAHSLKDSPYWEGICEDWEWLKNYVWKCMLEGTKVSSSQKGPNDYLCFNSCSGAFKYAGHNLRRRGGIQLKLGATLVEQFLG